MSSKHNSIATEHFTNLIQFRQAAYDQLGAARDALFELGDAIIDTPAANSFAELSCSKRFRRQWSSAYEALQDGRPDRTGLMELYCRNVKVEARPILVGDHTAWPRPSADTDPWQSADHAWAWLQHFGLDAGGKRQLDITFAARTHRQPANAL
jgi:hypothetical protein